MPPGAEGEPAVSSGHRPPVIVRGGRELPPGEDARLSKEQRHQSSPRTWCKSWALISSVKRWRLRPAGAQPPPFLLLMCVVSRPAASEFCSSEPRTSADALGAEVAAPDQPLVVLFDAEHPGEADQRRSLGKIPTTSVRRPISLLKRSSGLVERSLGQWPAGTRRRPGCRFRRPRAGSRPSHPPVEMRDRLGEPVARLVEVLGVEDRPDHRRQQPVLVLAGMPEAVSEEVNRAALPGAP